MKRFVIIMAMALMSLCAFADNYERSSDEPVYVTFWTNQNLTGRIAVYYNDDFVGYITKYYSGRPACGAAGCVTIQVRGTGNIWKAVGEDGTVWNSERVTLQPGCNTVRLYKSSSSTRTVKPSESSNTYGSAPKSKGVSNKERQMAEDVSASIGSAAGLLLGTALAQGPGWDKYAHRLDLGIGLGYGYGGLGVKINWQAPVVFGMTAGLGVSAPEGRVCWNIGMQMWCTDNWNWEIGLGSRYYGRYGDYMPGVIVSTNYQYPITDRFGILGGIGASGSTNSNPYVRFEFNLGLVFRLMSR